MGVLPRRWPTEAVLIQLQVGPLAREAKVAYEAKAQVDPRLLKLSLMGLGARGLSQSLWGYLWARTRATVAIQGDSAPQLHNERGHLVIQIGSLHYWPLTALSPKNASPPLPPAPLKQLERHC